MGNTKEFLEGVLGLEIDELDDSGDGESQHLWQSSDGVVALQDMGDSHLNNAMAMLQRRVADCEKRVQDIATELGMEPLCLPEKIRELTSMSREIEVESQWIGLMRNEQVSRKSRPSKAKVRRQNITGNYLE